MDGTSKKVYMIAIAVQLIYTGLSVLSKAAFDDGMSVFVFNFYRQVAGSLLLLPLALLFQRMEVVNLRSSSGIAKVSGAALCLAGVLVMAFYTGPALSPVNHHRAFAAHAPGTDGHANTSKAAWITGTFLMVLNNMAWSLSIVWQARILKEFPNRMLVAVSLCVFSGLQSFVVAAVAERDFSRWKLQLDVRLLAIAYTVMMIAIPTIPCADKLMHEMLATWVDESTEQGLVVTGVSYYLQAWCVEMKGPVFFAAWLPLYSVFTMFCSSFFLGEIVHLGSILGGILLIGGLYSVLWGKSKESKFASCSELNTIDGAQDEQEQNKPESRVEEKAPAAGGQV
ncbi:WAT1-related protein [Dichanthelium oligosanthes]|uniref:WAT1-related protein n=1 Tax=Dichanthelium oligosanthes TaxID=888268 RepID=A0A1E5VTV1_9POAL|nr:WAT1-related protein [Dichanthelium oligosanthes]